MNGLLALTPAELAMLGRLDKNGGIANRESQEGRAVRALDLEGDGVAGFDGLYCVAKALERSYFFPLTERITLPAGHRNSKSTSHIKSSSHQASKQRIQDDRSSNLDSDGGWPRESAQRRWRVGRVARAQSGEKVFGAFVLIDGTRVSHPQRTVPRWYTSAVS